MTRWGATAFHLALLYAAVAVGTSWVLLQNNSDTILQALISLGNWTPFYWGENRFGMLVPLLARPISDPALNMMFQVSVTAWSGLVAVWLLFRLTEDPALAAVATGLTMAGLPLLFQAKAGLVLVLASAYLPPLAVLLTGWYLFVRTDWPLAARAGVLFTLLTVSFWMNGSNIGWIGALAVLWPRYSMRERVTAAVVALSSNLLIMWFASWFPGAPFREILPVTQWLPSLWKLVGDAAATFVRAPMMIPLLLAGLWVLASRKRWDARLALGAACVAQTGLVAISKWVSINGSDSRYMATQLFVLAVLGLAVFAVPLAAALMRVQTRGAAYALAGLLTMAVATKAFGFPSLARGARHLEEVTRPGAASFPTQGCTHLIGDYFQVWMAVYHERLAGLTPRVPVSMRSEFVEDKTPRQNRVYCGPCAGVMVEYYRIQQKLPPFTPAGQNGPACTWTTP